MVFMRDAIVSPLFDAKELERERVVVTGEIDRNEATPYYHLFHTRSTQQRVVEVPVAQGPARQPRRRCSTATGEQMRTIQHRYYVPNNSALVVTGDVDGADVFAQADALYADWKRARGSVQEVPARHAPADQEDRGRARRAAGADRDAARSSGTGRRRSGQSVDRHLRGRRRSARRSASRRRSSRRRWSTPARACGANIGWYTQMNTGPITLGFAATPDKVDALRQGDRWASSRKLERRLRQPTTSSPRGAHARDRAWSTTASEPSELAHALTFWWTSAGLDYYLGYVDQPVSSHARRHRALHRRLTSPASRTCSA